MPGCSQHLSGKRLFMDKFNDAVPFDAEMICNYIELGGIYFEKGFNSFESWTDKFISVLGEDTRKYLLPTWKAVSLWPAGQKFNPTVIVNLILCGGLKYQDGYDTEDSLTQIIVDRFGPKAETFMPMLYAVLREWPKTNSENGEQSDQQESNQNVNDTEYTKRVLDELFSLTHQYKTSQAYMELLKFISRFHKYAPFNAMLVHIQMSGARYVLTPFKWLSEYGRTVNPGARPLVILRPMGPVMFVFDVSDNDGNSLPSEIECPFEPVKGKIGDKYEKILFNCKRDGVDVHHAKLGSQAGGSIRPAHKPQSFFAFGKINVPIRYEVELNESVSTESRYASLVHELAHLYCGHLGTPNQFWWPERLGLPHSIREIEAESVSYMVCKRTGIETPSEKYLAGHLISGENMPPISLGCIMKAAGLIESMGKATMEPRKAKQW
jgi:hypothetical protein